MFDSIEYTIRPYDTIWMLAQVFNTTVDSIMDLNADIDPRYLNIGQVIKIKPNYQYSSNSHAMVMGMDYNVYQTDMGNTDGMDNPNTMNNTNGMGEWYETGYTAGNTEVEQMADLVNYFRILWEEHVAWTRMAVMGIIHNLPETSQMINRLLRNPSDFAKAFEVYYGKEIADKFMQLMTDHLTIAAEVFKAEKEGNKSAYADADKRWHDNADEIAKFLSSINPYWNEDDWSAMMNEHLELLSNNVKQMLDGDYEDSVNGFDDIEMQALEMADMMADGIMRQFSGFED